VALPFEAAWDIVATDQMEDTMKKMVAGALALGMLAGCTTTSPEAEAVQVVGSPQAVAGCQFIKSVRGDQNMMGGYMLQGAAYHDAMNQLKRRTVEAGGNRVYMVNSNTGMAGSNVIGDAYKC
jgi:hypothetical protein